MATLLNRRRYMGGKALPYDAEVEYLESTGTQYIDIGIIPNIDLTVLVTSICYNGPILGSNIVNINEGTYMIGFLYQNKLNVQVGGNTIGIPIDQKKHNFKIDGTNKKLIIDELSEDIVNAYRSSGISLYLFGVNFRSRPRYYSCTLYSCEIKNNETPIFDAIPVRVGNIGYMYDRVSKKLFGNAGTGSFILGPDKN